jgi:predicted metalloprotease
MNFRPSGNVEDDREASASRRGMSVRAGGLGIGTVIVIGLISWYLGIDPSVLLNGAFDQALQTASAIGDDRFTEGDQGRAGPFS